MNNEDQFKNKTDQTPASSSAEWAKIVDRRERNASVEPAEPVDLTPQRLDDLELDGQLKMMGMLEKGSNSEDSFVGKVLAQTHPDSNSVPRNRPRLPLIGPSLVTDDLVAGAEASAAVTESRLASAADERIDERIDARSGSLPSRSIEVNRPTEVNQRRSVTRLARLALLATILFVGCFFGSIWWFGSAPEIADSPAPNASVGDLVRSEETSDQPDVSQPDAQYVPEAQKDAFEISSEGDGGIDRFGVDDAVVEKAMAANANVDSVAAAAASTASNAAIEEERRDVSESISNANSNPTSVDGMQTLDSVVGAPAGDLLGLGNDENPKDQSVADPSYDGPLWDSKFDWNLALQFHENGVGAVTLNGEPVQAIFLQDNSVFLLRKIAGEIQRRVRFLENRLGSKISGSIAVGESNYRFDDLAALKETVDKVDQQISKLSVRSLTVAELMNVRAGYRKEIFAKRKPFGSINLAHKNLRFYTEDEAFTICSILSASEATFRDLAKKRLLWEEENGILPPESNRSDKSKLRNCIEPKAFQHFANTGVLLPPDPRFTGQSVASIQNLGPFELQRMLQGAPSVELFRDANEFQQAKDFVYSNGPQEMRLRLSIDKIDRTLNNRAVVVTELAQEVLEDRKSRALRELRMVKMQGGNSRDGVALEPLRAVLAERTDLQGLPLVMGNECKSDATETSDLRQVSSSLGRTIGVFNGSLGSRDNAQNDAFRNLSIKEMVSYCMQDRADDPSSQKLKTIDQILQIDHPRLRLEMIGALRKSGSAAALKLMVNKAKFDLEPEVRIAATDALADIEPDKFRHHLLEGLTYPWHVVAEHSAEALVRLNDQGAVPKLIEMLDLPHPHFPFQDNGMLVQRELVGINHMRNCLLCHAPSISSGDSVRGLIPHSSRPLPRHYYDANGMATEVPYAVRADVTYLEQDFSLVQPVKNSGPWPRDQRFDYVVQKKRLTPVEAEGVARRISQSPNRNRNAIIFALRELTGQTPADNSSSHWRAITASWDDGK